MEMYVQQTLSWNGILRRGMFVAAPRGKKSVSSEGRSCSVSKTNVTARIVANVREPRRIT